MPAERLFAWRPAGTVAPVASPTALGLLRAAVAAASHRQDLRLHLVRALFNQHALGEVITLTRPSLAVPESDPYLLGFLGRAAVAVGDTDLALAALRQAADRGARDAIGDLVETLHVTGHADEALAMGICHLGHNPEDYRALTVVAKLLVARGERERLWALCTDLRHRGAWRAVLPSAMAAAATTSDQHQVVAELLDVKTWLAEVTLDVPPSFNADLSAELLAHHLLVPLPPTRATVGDGHRVEQLERDGGPRVMELLQHIRTAVDSYAHDRRARRDHPMITRAPARTDLQAWAIVLRRGGHETWHVHPDGWLSGVYYVDVPAMQETSTGPQPGSIEFGTDLFKQKEKSAAPLAVVRPEAGQLLLFPSYLGHRTWPTGVDAHRICVAFDIIPATAS